MNPKTATGLENQFDSVGVREDDKTGYENILLLSVDETTKVHSTIIILKQFLNFIFYGNM